LDEIKSAMALYESDIHDYYHRLLPFLPTANEPSSLPSPSVPSHPPVIPVSASPQRSPAISPPQLPIPSIDQSDSITPTTESLVAMAFAKESSRRDLETQVRNIPCPKLSSFDKVSALDFYTHYANYRALISDLPEGADLYATHPNICVDFTTRQSLIDFHPNVNFSRLSWSDYNLLLLKTFGPKDEHVAANPATFLDAIKAVAMKNVEANVMKAIGFSV
jgi:hypothetical protein